MRCIVHLDMDCFYAQVEALRAGVAPSRPLGVRQRGLLVTCNYAARARGLRKCMSVTEALTTCPELLLLPGEDLRPYRRASERVFTLLSGFGYPVERLGLDENFIDVTEGVKSRNNIDSNGLSFDSCGCEIGVHAALARAFTLAASMRAKILNELGLTCRAGVAHNKSLAKLVGAVRKPDTQTAIYPCEAAAFVSSLSSVRDIPGIGPKICDALKELGIENMSDLRTFPTNTLEKELGRDVASRLRNLSVGEDLSPVVPSRRKPSTVSIEESLGGIGLMREVEDRFRSLFTKLAEMSAEDGRRPGGIRISIRRAEKGKEAAHRYTRQCTLLPSLFRFCNNRYILDEGASDKIINIVMSLFQKCINLNEPFRITLLGLAFIKLREHKSGKSCIANYFVNDLSVHSVIDLRNEGNQITNQSITHTTVILPEEIIQNEPSQKKLRSCDNSLSDDSTSHEIETHNIDNNNILF